MYKPLMVTPSFEERQALLEMSRQDRREPWNQIRYLIAAEAERRGLLPVGQCSDASGQVLADPTGIIR